MIKAAAQAISAYAVSCFKFPEKVLEDINSMIANFWWSSRGNPRTIHWMPWSRLCHSKKESGLGFRDLKAFNYAVLGKQAWRLLTILDSLLFKVLQVQYFPNKDFLQAELGERPSFSWRGILEGQKDLELGCRIRVGNGASINIWSDPWLPRQHAFRVASPRVNLEVTTKVTVLIKEDRHTWNIHLITLCFLQEEAQYILSIPLGN